jgi:hypothetical protein
MANEWNMLRHFWSIEGVTVKGDPEIIQELKARIS